MYPHVGESLHGYAGTENWGWRNAMARQSPHPETRNPKCETRTQNPETRNHGLQVRLRVSCWSSLEKLTTSQVLTPQTLSAFLFHRFLQQLRGFCPFCFKIKDSLSLGWRVWRCANASPFAVDTLSRPAEKGHVRRRVLDEYERVQKCVLGTSYM